MRIGIFGGSFDPVHKGHLGIAWEVQQQCSLDKIIFIPTAQAPLKNHATEASAQERLAMLNCALNEYPGNAEVSDYEIAQGGLSYSIDTARHLRAENPAACLYWIIGADQVAELHRWHQIKELSRIISFIAVSRPAYPPPLRPDMPWLQLIPCQTQSYNISSTQIREKLTPKAPIDSLTVFLPKTVAQYIREHHIYQ